MLLSTVEDLRAWSDALFGGRVFRSPETLALMNEPHAEVPGTGGEAAYGYGLVVGKVPVGGHAVPVAQHDGGTNGFMTGLWRLTGRDGVIAVCSNAQDGTDELAMGILASLYGEPAGLHGGSDSV
jgi:CubicO group peptidase (beta-lactamase class C family)